MQHRYKVGELVTLLPDRRHSNRPAGACRVISCLPHEGGPLLYRIKSPGEAVERVVQESDLSPNGAEDKKQAERDDVFRIAVQKR